jgi:hypothetical protein
LSIFCRVGFVSHAFRFENVRWAVEQSTGPLQCDNRVVERGLLRTVRDRLDLFQLLPHSGLDRRNEVLVLDFVEGRVVIRQQAFGCERIVIEIGGGHGGDLRSVKQRASEDAKSMWHNVDVEFNVIHALHHIDLVDVDLARVAGARRIRV